MNRRQFTIRDLLLAMTVAASVLALISWAVQLDVGLTITVTVAAFFAVGYGLSLLLSRVRGQRGSAKPSRRALAYGTLFAFAFVLLMLVRLGVIGA